MRRALFLLSLLVAAPAFAARTPIAVSVSSHTGTLLSFVAADVVNGNSFTVNDGRAAFTALVVQNSGATAITLTIFTNLTEDGDLVLPNRVVSVPAGRTGIIGPFPSAIFTQNDGSIWFSLSGAANVLPLQISPAQ